MNSNCNVMTILNIQHGGQMAVENNMKDERM